MGQWSCLLLQSRLLREYPAGSIHRRCLFFPGLPGRSCKKQRCPRSSGSCASDFRSYLRSRGHELPVRRTELRRGPTQGPFLHRSLILHKVIKGAAQ